MPDVPLLERLRNPAPVVGVLRLDGIIGGMGPFRKGLTLSKLNNAIERAFKLWRLEAVALAINSPGGSAVQSALIARRIRELADENGIPVFAFAEDVAASGGYWLALAADEIYANESSIIGSIGVVSGGFGFSDLIKRLGIERRLHTAGAKKVIMDPFQPEKPSDVSHLKGILADIHESFEAMVRESRGKRLKGKEKELFSGAFWTGAKALELGLIDGLGDMRGVLRDKFGERVKLKEIRKRTSFWHRRMGLSGPLGRGGGAQDWAGSVIAAIEERLIWNRFGL